jgi:hypothetical protein
MRQNVAAINLLGRIGQPHRHNLQSEFSSVPMLQFENHPRRAAFDLLQLRILVRDAFGKNPDRFPGFEHAEARLEGVGHCAHGLGIILDAVNGNHTAAGQQPFHRPEPEKLHGGDKVHLARHRRADHKRVGQRVRVIGNKQDRPAPRHTLGMKPLDAPEIKPQRQTQQRAQGAV